MTGNLLVNHSLTENKSLKSDISEWKMRNPGYSPPSSSGNSSAAFGVYANRYMGMGMPPRPTKDDKLIKKLLLVYHVNGVSEITDVPFNSRHELKTLLIRIWCRIIHATGTYANILIPTARCERAIEDYKRT